MGTAFEHADIYVEENSTMDNQGSPEILAYLMKIFKHSSQETTLRYICLESEKEKDLYMNHNLGLDTVEDMLSKLASQDINNIKKMGAIKLICQSNIQSANYGSC